MTEKIDFNARRRIVTDTVSIFIDELEKGDLHSIGIGDWIEGIGSIKDFGVIGFLHHLSRIGLRIVREEKVKL